MADTKVHVVMTGGTIDSEYNGVIDTVTAREQSVVPKFLKSIRVARDFTFTTVCLKDSRMLTAEDRIQIQSIIRETNIDRVLITHGIYTIPETARYLEEHFADSDKTIVLTGSMVPLDGFTMTDAGFNLGYSIAQLDCLSAGVFVCLNGTTFRSDEVVELANQERFHSIFSEEN